MKGRRILIVDGHPDPDHARLVHALADRYAEGALACEHEVRRIDLATADIPERAISSGWWKGARASPVSPRTEPSRLP